MMLSSGTMKTVAMPLRVFTGVWVCLLAGCASDQSAPQPEAGPSPTDARAEAAAALPWVDGGPGEAGTVLDSEAAEGPDAGGGDSPWHDGGAREDGIAAREAGVVPDGVGRDATQAGDRDGTAEDPRDTRPDTSVADERSALIDAVDGDAGRNDGADAAPGRDASDGRADVAWAREVASTHDATDATEGGASPGEGEGERIWVYLLAGQSNMVGVGICQKLAPQEAALVPGASVYYSDPVSSNQQAGQWLPLGPGFGVTTDHFGPELAFGRRMQELHPRRRLAIIKVAEGGTGLYDRWRATTGDLYQRLLRETRTQLGVLAVEGRPQLAGLVWMQGESDASAQVRAEAYQKNLTDFILALRSDLGSALLPVVAGLIAQDYGWPFGEQVREATRQVAAQLGRTEVVETDDLHMDWDGYVHYDADGNLHLGWRFAEAMDSMQGTRWRFPEDFAVVQGEGCFRYRDRTDTDVTPLVYDGASTRWAGDSGAAIGQGFMLPGPGRQAELAFWAPFAGDVEVTFRTTMPSSASAGVGIVAASPFGVLAGPAGLAFPTPIWLSFHLAVAQGDEIFFRTSPGSAPDPDHDTTNWQIDITMTRVDE